MSTRKNALREWRKRKGLSQSELGTLLGINRFEISHYERMARYPGLKTAQKIEVLTDGEIRFVDLINPKWKEKALKILGL